MSTVVIFLLSSLVCTTVYGTNLEHLCVGGTEKSKLFPLVDDTIAYWECLHGVKTFKYCPENHHFNQVSQKCHHFQDLLADIDASMCKPNVVEFVPHPSECSKYIWCYNGTAYVMDCEEGKWFSTVEKYCVVPALAHCTTTIEPPWTTPDNHICANVPEGDIILKKCECGCDYYWECNGTTQTLKMCPNLFFSEERQFCTGSFYCKDSTRTPFPWTTTFSPITEKNPSYNDPRCRQTNEERFFVAHPYCTKFIECTVGNSFERDCPDGLYFNAVAQKCGPLAKATCDNFSTIAPDDLN